MLTAQRPCKRAVKRKANAGSISAYVLPAPSLACGVGFWAAAETRARGLRQQQIQAPISLASRRSRSIAALLQGIAPAWHIAWAVLGVAASPLVQAAAFTVGAGGAAYHGTIDLACDDLEVNGPLDASGALFTGVGRVRISAAGSIAAAGARIELGAGWHNAAGPAGFSGSGSTVAVVGRCSTGSTADITGNTTFVHLSAVQAGQTLRFAAGSEQQVAGTLTLNDVTLQGQGGYGVCHPAAWRRSANRHGWCGGRRCLPWPAAGGYRPERFGGRQCTWLVCAGCSCRSIRCGSAHAQSMVSAAAVSDGRTAGWAPVAGAAHHGHAAVR